MIKKTLISSILLLVAFYSFSQNEKPDDEKQSMKKERPNYIGITLGFGAGNFRDFATSPLIYNGNPFYLSLSTLKMDNKRETESLFSFTVGNYSSIYNNHSASSNVYIFSLFHSELFQLNKLSSEKWNVKIGGLLNATANLRFNPSLLNNDFGYEIIPTLFGSMKVTRDISRERTKNKKFLFIKYKLKPTSRNLAVKLNVGLINSAYRNGYAYTGQSSILNELKAFDDYQFKLFSGFRINTVLDYTVALKNKNKIQFSYLWDAYKTGGDFNKLEMAQHTFKITLLFNTNNK